MRERPASGLGHYLRDVVYGAADGIVTTFAIVAGVSGASLAPWTALALGLANLLADGVSMGAGNYLAIRSELEQTGVSLAIEKPASHGLASFLAFVLWGALPLVAFLLAPGDSRLLGSAAVSCAALFAAGSLRARFIARPAWRCGAEMLAIGVCAGAVAFGVGLGARWLL